MCKKLLPIFVAFNICIINNNTFNKQGKRFRAKFEIQRFHPLRQDP